MKYIVVYTILILGLTTLNAEAQKPTIDLLPTTSESLHPEAMIDTSIIHDSLVLFDSLSPVFDTLRVGTAELKDNGDVSSDLSKRNSRTANGRRPILYSLIFKNNNPISFIIYFTALKF